MIHVFIQLSKYLMAFFFMFYTYGCFHIFKYKDQPEKISYLYHLQRVMMFLIQLNAFLILYFSTGEIKLLKFYLMQVSVIAFVIIFYRLAYKKSSPLLLNNMCMLLVIGFIMLTRLSYTKATKQFIFLIAGILIAILIPVILKQLSIFRKLTWLYAILGILALMLVAGFGSTSYGAKLSLSFAGISVQPSEFVKILFVFFIAAMLYKENNFKQVLLTGAVASVFVLMLVASRDLGGALLYYVTFLCMLYVATQKILYLIAGLGGAGIAGFLGYYLFSHVQTRVLAWKDPLAVIDNEGYQVSQSLFGIGTGGWFGLGLNQGLPRKIPVVEKDFIFAAIAEEMGGVFAICLIMVCISCFFMIMNIAMQLKDNFYKLVALGLGTLYAMQVFLTIGGVIKFIPSTGVTLPLVSYGGSSLLSTMIIFGIIQGLYMRPAKNPQKKVKEDGYDQKFQTPDKTKNKEK